MRKTFLTTIGAITLLLFSITFFSFDGYAKTTPDNFADLSEKLLPTVVNISISQSVEADTPLPELDLPDLPETSPFKDFFEDFYENKKRAFPSLPQAALGSGFVIDAKEGYIVTNNHVVKNADNIRITFHDDKTVSAKLIGTDDKTDLAVLKIDPKEYPGLVAAEFGDSKDLRIGEWILVIGNPFGLGGSVSAGIVSARARDINSGPYDDFIQTDASINRGNSGGPMFDTDGNVVGINTAIFSPTGGSVGIGFAIPSDLAKPVIDQIIKYGRTRRGWLGVRIQEVTKDIADSLGLTEAYGALVASPTEGSPADLAGIKAGDVVIEFDGKRVNEMRELPRMVAETEIDRKIDVVVWRDGKKKSFKIKLGELEKAEEEGLLNDKAEPTKLTENEVELEREGMSLSSLNEELASRFGIDPSVKGVVIVDVVEDSEALKKGLMPGDVIIEVAQTPVKQPEDVKKALDKERKAGKKSALLLVNKAGDIRFIAVRLNDGKEN